MTRLNLPTPIAAYFKADQQKDAEAIAQCFTAQAVVKDEGRTRTGAAAIKAWKIESSTKYTYTSVPTGIEQRGDDYVVTSRVAGNFPGSPVDLHYTFRLERDRIAFLGIAP